MTSEAERFNLAHDLGDFRQIAGDAGRLDLAPVIYETWARLPDEDRRALRGRYETTFVSGAGARVCVPLDALGRPVIYLGCEIPVAELPSSFAHELAHLHLSHLDARPPRPMLRTFANDWPAHVVAELLAAGWTARPLSEAEIDRERAAWAQVRAWGFTVPDDWQE